MKHIEKKTSFATYCLKGNLLAILISFRGYGLDQPKWAHFSISFSHFLIK
jgi:hypothetical protein